MAQATSIPPLAFPAPRTTVGSAQPVLPAAGSLSPEAPRKLVRPRLPEHLAQAPGAPRRLRGERPLSLQDRAGSTSARAAAPAGTAEGFFLQKQMQAQTPLVFVMEDNEKISGTIEWYDRDTIKVRSHTRVLIFKRSLKYLYKASDLHLP